MSQSNRRRRQPRDPAEPRHRCPSRPCARDFSSPGHVARHLREEHPQYRPDPADPMYVVCVGCDEVYSQGATYENHLRICQVEPQVDRKQREDKEQDDSAVEVMPSASQASQDTGAANVIRCAKCGDSSVALSPIVDVCPCGAMGHRHCVDNLDLCPRCNDPIIRMDQLREESSPLVDLQQSLWNLEAELAEQQAAANAAPAADRPVQPQVQPVEQAVQAQEVVMGGLGELLPASQELVDDGFLIEAPDDVPVDGLDPDRVNMPLEELMDRLDQHRDPDLEALYSEADEQDMLDLHRQFPDGPPPPPPPSPPPPGPAAADLSNSEELVRLFLARPNLMPKIPKAATNQWIHAVKPILRQVKEAAEAQDNKALTVAVNKFMVLPAQVLHTVRGGKQNRNRIARAVANRLRAIDEDNNELLRVPERAPARGGIEREKAARVRRAVRLAKEGYLGRAARALTGKSLTLDPEQIRAQLDAQHPQPAAPQSIPRLPREAPRVIIDPDDASFASTIKASANGAAAGLSGWRADYLLPLLQDDEARRLLAMFFQLLINAELPKSPMLACFLIAVAKTPEKVRPIALGEVFFRIATRLAHGRISQDHLTNYFGDIQLAFAPGASETAVHKIVSEAMQAGHAVLGVDVANAFNTLSRAKAIQAIFNDPEMAPIWRILHYAYGEAVQLHHVGDDGFHKTIASAEGFRQGDLLAGLVFAYAIQPALRAVLAELPTVKATAIYDDVSFTGPPADLINAYRSFAIKMAELGLQLQPDKSFLIALNGEAISQQVQQEAIALRVPVKRNVRLLGTQVGIDQQLVRDELLRAMQDRYEQVWSGIGHELMPVQIAMSLLRVAAVPMLGYLMRTTPADALMPTALAFDESVITAAARKLKVDEGDLQLQTTLQLPLRHGGFGLRPARKVMHFAYVGAFAQAAPLIKSAAGMQPVRASLAHIHTVVTDEQILARLPPPNAPAAAVLAHFAQAAPANNLKLQRAMTRFVAKREHAAIRAGHVAAGRAEDTARVTSTAGAAASAFLLAEPTMPRTTINDSEFILASHLRLGVPLDGRDRECGCSRASRSVTTHMFSCKHRGKGDTYWRHTLVRDCLMDLISEAGCSVRKEPAGLVADNGKRPDLEVYINDECKLIDVTVTVPTSRSYLAAAAVPRQVLRRAEMKKQVKYDPVALAIKATFVPFAMDLFGGFGEQAIKFLSLLSTHAEERAGYNRATFYRHAVNSLACALVRGNERVYRHWINAWRS